MIKRTSSIGCIAPLEDYNNHYRESLLMPYPILLAWPRQYSGLAQMKESQNLKFLNNMHAWFHTVTVTLATIYKMGRRSFPITGKKIEYCVCSVFSKAGIPDGVLNVVPGFGPTAGATISSHMLISLIHVTDRNVTWLSRCMCVQVSFTGSTEVGGEIMHAAASSNLKQVSLELRGKSPLLIFQGEICVASSRVFVQEGIYNEFEKKLVEKAKAWVVGDPFDPKSQQGPQVDKKQFEKILSYIEHGKKEGATLLYGGKRLGDKGYYIEPTIFSDVKGDMLIAQDEIFGPVMSLMKFKTIEEAIMRANNTKYGLAAGIVTKNLDIANTVSRSIRAGIVWINCYFIFGSDIPYGGYKQSGFGKEYVPATEICCNSNLQLSLALNSMSPLSNKMDRMKLFEAMYTFPRT
ncbi:hypothetical protein AHAS_Ahas05G0223000 [Arachis hypogaea]